MEESLNDAKEELKRVDHLIYVSLKYTRTVDVLLNVIRRMIDAYDFMMEALLLHALEEGKIEELPKTPRERGESIIKIYDDDLIKDNINLYFLNYPFDKKYQIAYLYNCYLYLYLFYY